MAVLTLACGVGAGAWSSLAQSPSPAGKEKKSYIRFWNMLPDKMSNNLLVLANDKPLFGAAPLDLYNDYVPSPVGSYNIVVKHTGDDGAIVQKVPAAMLENTFVTLLATEKNGQPTVELLNDTPDPKVADLSARVIVRSFFPGGRVAVGVAGGPLQTIANGTIVTLDNLPMTASASIVVQVSQAAVPPASKTWNVPADFSVTHHATLLLTPDHYDRLVPRLIYNGRLAHSNVAPQGVGH